MNLQSIENTRYLVDEEQQVVLQRKNLVNNDNRCPNIKVFATEYDNLYLTSDMKVMFKAIDDIDFITLLDSKLEFAFLIYVREILKQNLLNSVHTCSHASTGLGATRLLSGLGAPSPYV